MEPLEWRAHPAAQRPVKTVLAAGIILIVAGFVYVTTASIGMAVLGIVLLTAALNRFFCPSRFTIDDEGITAEYPLRKLRHRWSELQRFVWDEHGGYLSTRAVGSRLDAYRGMHLLFDEPNREQIIETIRARMGEKQKAESGERSS
jgi:hypothetical protein